MSREEYWTEKRIARLERLLHNHGDDAAAKAFLAKLALCRTIDEKRKLITEDLVPTLQIQDSVKIWQGQVIPTRLVLRDILQDFLHGEGIAENVPTNEPDTPEEAAERERLARRLSAGKSATEIVIEDRGPR